LEDYGVDMHDGKLDEQLLYVVDIDIYFNRQMKFYSIYCQFTPVQGFVLERTIISLQNLL